MLLEFQSICIISSVALLMQNSQNDVNGYAFLLFVVGVLSHALEGLYEHHNASEERKSQAIQNLFGSVSFKTNKKYDYDKMMKEWEEEEKEEEGKF